MRPHLLPQNQLLDYSSFPCAPYKLLFLIDVRTATPRFSSLEIPHEKLQFYLTLIRGAMYRVGQNSKARQYSPNVRYSIILWTVQNYEVGNNFVVKYCMLHISRENARQCFIFFVAVRICSVLLAVHLLKINGLLFDPPWKLFCGVVGRHVW